MNRKFTGLAMILLLMCGCTAGTGTTDTENVTEETTARAETKQQDSAEKTAETKKDVSDPDAQNQEEENTGLEDGESGFMDLVFSLPDGYSENSDSGDNTDSEMDMVTYNDEDGSLILMMHFTSLPDDDTDSYGEEFSQDARYMADTLAGSLGSDYSFQTPTVGTAGQNQYASITYDFTVTQDDGDKLDGRIAFVDVHYNLYAIMLAEHVGEQKTDAFNTMLDTLQDTSGAGAPVTSNS